MEFIPSFYALETYEGWGEWRSIGKQEEIICNILKPWDRRCEIYLILQTLSWKYELNINGLHAFTFSKTQKRRGRRTGFGYV